MSKKIKNSKIPKVSVIIPVYNTAKYLHECLDSIINKTMKEIEIICINDGSTDNSLNILKEYAQQDKRIHIINRKTNCGAPGLIKNIGIEHATGEYIGFLDSDDWIDNNYFKELYNIAMHNAADVASCTKMIRFNSEQEWCTIYDCNRLNLLTNIYEKKPLIQFGGSNCLKIFKKKFIKKNQLKCWTKKSIAEDNYLSMISMLLANKIAVTDKVAYHYRKGIKSITGGTRTNKDFNIFHVYKNIDRYINNLVIPQSKKNIMLSLLNVRKMQDFTWFKDTLDIKYLDDFKHKLKKTFPDIYDNLFGKQQLIISLTSYPARINTVNKTIETLLNQSLKADKIILWLAPEQFPNREADLPKQLLDLCNQGLTIDWYHDIRSYKKLIPTLQKYTNAIIITTDDDVIYHKDMIKNLYNSYKKQPRYIHCHRAHKITIKNKTLSKYNSFTWFNKQPKEVIASFHQLFTGVGGVLYPPKSLHANVINESEFMKLCPQGDDIWFWANAILNDTKIQMIKKRYNPKIIDGTQETALWIENLNNNKNDQYIANIIEKHPRILTILLEEIKMLRKSYLFFPYYLLANLWLKLISIPLAKKKHK